MRPAKHFLNPQFKAPNIVEVDLDPAVLARCDPLIEEVRGAHTADGAVRAGGLDLYVSRPDSWASDVAWISQDDLAGYGFFKALFDDLDIARHVADHVDHDGELVLYSGFFVTRTQCSATDFHVDWKDGGNNGFTLLAPLTDHGDQFELAYQRFDGSIGSYRYQAGKGVLFGSLFRHGTGLGRTDQPAVLLCFNFGTDRMEHWPALAVTTADQGRTHVRPDGVFVRVDS